MLKQKWVSRLFAALLALAVLWLCAYAALLRESPFSGRRQWEAPSFVAAGENMAVIEASKTRVTLLNAQAEIEARIRGGKVDAASFYYAEYAATDGETVCVADVTHAQNSSHVTRERILRFSRDGKYLETLYTVEYAPEEQPLQLGRIQALAMRGERVYFLRLEGAGWGLYEIQGGAVRKLRDISAQGEAPLRAGYDPLADIAVLTTKQGGLILDQGGKQTRLAYGDGQRLVWAVGHTDGQVFASELWQEAVVRVADGKPLCGGGLYYCLSAANGSVATTDGETVYRFGVDGTPSYVGTDAPLCAAYHARILLTWAAAVYAGLAALLLLWRLFALVRAARAPGSGTGAVVLGLVMLLTAGLVSGYILSAYQTRQEENSMAELRRLTDSFSETSGHTFGDAFARIDALADHGNADYAFVRQYLDAFCDQSADNGLNLYYILYKYDDETIWGVMDYEDTIATRTPYMAFAGSGYDRVALTGDTLCVASEKDIFGTWSYVIAPVYTADGTRAGLLEIGANRYSEALARREMEKTILVTTLAALVMVLLLLGELGAYRDCLHLRRAALRTGEKRTVLGFLRPLVFLLFLGDNFDASYIPQISAQLYARTALPRSASMGAAFPMSAQLFAIALAALFAGRIVDRRGIRQTLLASVALRLAGGLLALMGVGWESYALLLVGKLVGGFGTGAMMVACDALPACAEAETERAKLFSGLNVGLIAGVVLGCALGGYAAQYLGYVAAYACAAALTLLCGAASLAYVGADARPPAREETGAPLGAFLRQPAVFGFLLFAMIPFMVMLYFKDYLFPLYSASLGYGEASIGNVLLLGGSLSIFLGNVLPDYMFARYGVRRALLIASVVMAGGLLLFMLRESYLSAVLAVCAISFASAFGMAGQGVYFSELAAKAGVGSGEAMGVYNLADNLGQTCGPLLLGALLFLGYGRAAGAAAGLALLLLLLFALLTRERGKTGGKKHG